MKAPTRREKHWTLGSLAVACLLFDVGALIGLSNVVKWLVAGTSPFVVAGLAATLIVAARVFQNLRRIAGSAGAPVRL